CEIALQNTGIVLAAQNVSSYDQGAYTGEVSAAMLLDVECEYALIGHSERRGVFGETDQDIAQKMKQVLEYEMQPVLCIGESQLARKAGKTFAYLEGQLAQALRGLHEE